MALISLKIYIFYEYIGVPYLPLFLKQKMKPEHKLFHMLQWNKSEKV
jgi:hypothetical protein